MVACTRPVQDDDDDDDMKKKNKKNKKRRRRKEKKEEEEEMEEERGGEEIGQVGEVNGGLGGAKRMSKENCKILFMNLSNN